MQKNVSPHTSRPGGHLTQDYSVNHIVSPPEPPPRPQPETHQPSVAPPLVDPPPSANVPGFRSHVEQQPEGSSELPIERADPPGPRQVVEARSDTQVSNVETQPIASFSGVLVTGMSSQDQVEALL